MSPACGRFRYCGSVFRPYLGLGRSVRHGANTHVSVSTPRVRRTPWRTPDTGSPRAPSRKPPSQNSRFTMHHHRINSSLLPRGPAASSARPRTTAARARFPGTPPLSPGVPALCCVKGADLQGSDTLSQLENSESSLVRTRGSLRPSLPARGPPRPGRVFQGPPLSHRGSLRSAV